MSVRLRTLFFDGCKTNVHNATELDGVRPGATGRRLQEGLIQPWEGLSSDAWPGAPGRLGLRDRNAAAAASVG